MFIVLLKFAANRSRASQFMEGHKAWIERGFKDGVFLVAGSLVPQQGGGILAHNASLTELEERIAEDPFVVEGVVSAEVIEITPSKADTRMDFLMG